MKAKVRNQMAEEMIFCFCSGKIKVASCIASSFKFVSGCHSTRENKCIHVFKLVSLYF